MPNNITRDMYYSPQVSNGDLVLCQAMYDGNYHYIDRVCVVKNTRYGKALQCVFEWLSKHAPRIGRYDADSLGLSGGELFPKYSLTYWWMRPFVLANRWCRQSEYVLQEFNANT